MNQFAAHAAVGQTASSGVAVVVVGIGRPLSGRLGLCCRVASSRFCGRFPGLLWTVA